MIKKGDSIKSWEKLEEEINNSHLTSFCRQDFASTKDASYNDNNLFNFEKFEDYQLLWKLDDYQLLWKLDVMFRMLVENLDYGKFEKTEEECSCDYRHSILMEIRATIVNEVAEEWVKVNGKVSDIESAQKFADELIANLKSFLA